MANHLRVIIGGLIGPFQLAFIPGRQLHESAVVAGEIVSAWKRTGTKGFICKVDFAKAYDSLDWKFLWPVMRKRGFPKSAFVGFGLSSEEETLCARVLDTPRGSLPMRYLGLPLTGRRLLSTEWQPVIDKVGRRLKGWQSRVPVGVAKRLKGLMRRFFWGGNGEGGRGIPLVAWDVVCRPMKQGGLGILHLESMNLVLLAKCVEGMVSSTEGLAIKVLRDVYDPSLNWERGWAHRRGNPLFGVLCVKPFLTFGICLTPSWGTGEESDFGLITGQSTTR
ncbi:uncharacterized protein LOC144707136 [Wolffia australiana]